MKNVLLVVTLCFIINKSKSQNVCANETDSNLLVDYGPSYPVRKNNYSDELCSCSDRPCIRKCCTFGYSVVNTSCVKNDHEFKVPVYEDKVLVNDSRTYFNYIFGMHCMDYYMVKPQEVLDDEFFVQADGTLWFPSAGSRYDLNNFCVEHFRDIGLRALVCFKDVKAHRLAKNVNTVGRDKVTLKKLESFIFLYLFFRYFTTDRRRTVKLSNLTFLK